MVFAAKQHDYPDLKRQRVQIRNMIGRMGDSLKTHGGFRRDSRMPSGSGWMMALAAVTAGAAAVVQERSHHAERNNPPRGRFITVDGVRLHYIERGQGDPLVLLHGNVTMGLDFLLGDLVDRAARNHRVLVFDRPGFGHSERPRGRPWSPEAQARLLHGALQQLGVQRPLVLGHSLGTMVALALALDYPGFVGGLVLESGYYYPTARLDVLPASVPAIPVLGDLLRYTFGPLLGRAGWALTVKAMFAPAKVPDYFWRFPAWMALRPSQVRAISQDAANMIPAAMRLSQRYLELDLPVVIVAGSEDPVAHPESHAERLHRELAGSDLRMIPGCGHMVHHLAPQAVLDAIEAAGTQMTR